MSVNVASAEAIAPPAGTAAAEWKAQWPVILAGFFGTALCSIGVMAMGTFMGPMEKSFGWTRAEFSAGWTINAIAGIFIAPLVGVLVDRWGARRLMVPGALLSGVAFSLFATSSSSEVYWLALWLLYAAVNAMMLLVCFTSVSSVFSVSRGLALSVIMCGHGLSAMIVPPLANMLIETQGWRQAFVVLGVGGGAICALFAYLAFHGRRAPAVPPSATRGALSFDSVRDAFRSRSFLYLASANLIFYVVSIGLTVHLVPILSAGIGRDRAVLIAGSFGLALIAGKLLNGVALDRLPPRIVIASWLSLMVLGFATLLLPSPTAETRLVAVTFLGVANGGIAPAFPYLVSRFFGVSNFGKMYGVMSSGQHLGSAAGPLVAAVIYDRVHDYGLFLIGAIPALLIVMLLMVSSDQNPTPPAAERPTGPIALPAKTRG